MKFKKCKKILLIILGLVLFGMFYKGNVYTVNAADDIPDGYTPIYTFEDLYAIRNNLDGKYILMNDIDMSRETAPGGDWDVNGNGWEPIGHDTPFRGLFDGNGHTISGINIHGEVKYQYLGLFGCVRDKRDNTYHPEIINLAVKDVNINVTKTKAYTPSYVGAIAGAFQVENSVGRRSEGISNCYAKGTISITNKVSSYTDSVLIGGIVGEYNEHDLCSGDTIDQYIDNCYSSVDITVNDIHVQENSLHGNNGYIVGGIIGTLSLDMLNCYSIGKFSNISTSDKIVIKKGPVIGDDYNYCTNCYYLNGVYPGTNSGSLNCKGLTAGQMKSQAAFTNWDFKDTWVIDKTSSYQYPQLRKVMEIPVTSVNMVSLPNKTAYFKGQTLDLNGATIGVSHSDNSYGTTNVTTDMVSGYDMNKLGKQYVTVTYLGKSTSFEINVSPDPANCNHVWSDWVITKNPTCLKQGTKQRRCMTCEVEENGIVNATGHRWNKWSELNIQPTCTHIGQIFRECDECGTIESHEMDAIDHKIVLIKGVAATCTKSGKTNGLKCSMCGNIIQKQETIPPTHKVSKWKTTKKATVLKKGQKTGKCSVCKKTVKQTIPKVKATISVKSSVSVKVKKSTTIKVKYKKGDGIKSWSSNNKKVATVTKKGKVTGKSVGTAILTVKLKSGKTAKVTVTVK